jgi:sterol desaturase/sphingolipid hydroxylase (fatty acid hydroxylase superfamily)
MTTALLTALSSLLVLMIVFVPLERLFPARAGQRVLRPGLAIDATFFFGQYLVWNGAALSMLSALRMALASRVVSLEWLTGGPPWLRAVLAVVLGDVAVYWFHRACHAFEPLWRFHAVHHSAEHLDFLAAHREHPLDGIGTQLAANLPAFVMGFDVQMLAPLIALRGMWAIFVHSNVRLPLGPLRILLGAPELHHWHHARVGRTRHNFANVAPFIDVIFGTHHLPEGPESYPLGLEEPWPKGYAAQLVRPFVVTWARAASRTNRASSETRSTPARPADHRRRAA